MVHANGKPFVAVWYPYSGGFWRGLVCWLKEHNPVMIFTEYHYDGSESEHYRCSRCGARGVH